jgi:K+-sensing histidine kinase KdpD
MVGITSDNITNSVAVLTGISHEMRTQMNSIVAFSFLIKENYCCNNEGEEFTNHIISSCEKLLDLFESFLDSELLSSGNLPSEDEVCKLSDIIDEITSEFRDFLSKDGRSDLEIITDFQFSNFQEILIDKGRLIRVIRNLFQSSMRNTRSGYIKIGYCYCDDHVNFYVLDSGQGYSKCKEYLQTENLNESLSLHNDTYTAINITLAKKLIQILGGKIRIECNGPAGTGIYFSVPARIIEHSGICTNNYINTTITI